MFTASERPQIAADLVIPPSAGRIPKVDSGCPALVAGSQILKLELTAISLPDPIQKLFTTLTTGK